MKRRAACFAIAVCALCALPSVASAATIVVNANGDTIANDNTCTLREAIIAANTNAASTDTMNRCIAGEAEPTVDVINFANPPFNGMVNTTITTTGLPDISEDLTIDAGTIGGITKPRVGVSVSPANGDQALAITNGAAVVVDGLAITNALVGIDGTGGTVQARDVWIGLSLNQNVVGANSVGIQLASNSVIGSLSADGPNVFAANATGILSLGGDNNSIIRNYFGSKPDGTLTTTPSDIRNGTNIRIVNNPTGPDPAVGNAVGGADTGDPNICDTTCNLLSNGTGDGIALVGGGGDPATGLNKISGNYIGLGFNGASGLGNTGNGITVGSAAHIVIGGESDAERNFIAGNSGKGVESVSDNLVLTRNFFGLNATGTAALPNGAEDLLINTGGDTSTISRNRIGGRGFTLFTNNSQISSNIFGIGTGGEDVGHPTATPLAVIGSNNTIGGVGAGNTIANHKLAGEEPTALALDGSNNDVFGNFIGVDSSGVAHPNASNGITLSFNGLDSDNNDIGGAAAGQGNTISNSGRDAIHLPSNGSGSDGNKFELNLGRNNGSDASDLFIDLGSDGPGNGDGGFPPAPNGGVLAPVILFTPDNDSISGLGPSGDTSELVEVYKTVTLRGDVKEYLGSVGANPPNSWTFNFASPLPDGTCIGVTWTQDGSISEMTTTSIGGGPCDATAPIASISSGPADGAVTNDRTPTFGLNSNEAGSTFECNVDDGGFTGCSNPSTLPSLGDGNHSLQVRATDPVGNLGNPSAVRSFQVDATAPNTTVTSFVKKPKRRRATITFSSNDAGATFQCKLNAKPFLPCASPKVFRRLKRGRRHTFQVRATDSVGNVDSTPTVNRIRIPRRRR